MTSVLTTSSKKILLAANDWVTEYRRDPCGGIEVEPKNQRHGHLSIEVFRSLKKAMEEGDADAWLRYKTATLYPEMAQNYMRKHVKAESHAECELINVFTELLREGHTVGLETLGKAIHNRWGETLFTPHLKPTHLEMAVVAASTKKGWEWWCKRKPWAFPYEQKRDWGEVISRTYEESINRGEAIAKTICKIKRLKSQYFSEKSKDDQWFSVLSNPMPMTQAEAKRYVEACGIGENAMPLVQELARRSFRAVSLLGSPRPRLLFGNENYEAIAAVALQSVTLCGPNDSPLDKLSRLMESTGKEFQSRVQKIAQENTEVDLDFSDDRYRHAISRLIEFVGGETLRQKHAASYKEAIKLPGRAL